MSALTDALHPVFLVAAGIAVLAFVLSWFLREVPLKATAQAPDVGDGFQAASEDSALREMGRALSLLAGREQRWELYERLAARAALDLSPPELWLLARLGERPPLTEPQLTGQLRVDARQVAQALDQLSRRSLVSSQDGGTIILTTSGRASYEQLIAAKCAGLRELLDGWHPDDHAELRQLIDRLARDLVSEIPIPVAAAA